MDARPSNANNTRELFTRNMDASSSSERWSQQLLDGGSQSQDWSTWLGSSQETQQRCSGMPARPTVSWSHAAAGRGGGVRMPPTQPSLQQMPLTTAPLPDPRDVTLARDIRIGLHTILSVMSSVPEQLREVAAEVGRTSLQQQDQQHPQHHEETRRAIRDTGDTLQALLTGLQEAVTQLQQGQDQTATLQKEGMKKHEELMEEIIKKMDQLGWRQREEKEMEEEKEKEEKEKEEEKKEEEQERAKRERMRLEEVLAETKKELRRQVRRLKMAAAGRTASVERAVEGLQEGVSKVCGGLEEVKGLVMQPPPRHDDTTNKSNSSNSPIAAFLRQLRASTSKGFEKVESSISSLKQEVSGVPSHLSEEINQAVREALQQHPIIINTLANTTTPNGSSTNAHNPNTSISVSPIQRTFSAHRPVLPLNENFGLCLSSPVAHVSPITQVSPTGTITTSTITTTANTTTASTTTSSHQYHHQHHQRQQAYGGSASRQQLSGHSQRPASPPSAQLQHPSSQSNLPAPPPPPPSRHPTGHSNNKSRPSHPQQSLNCARTTPSRQLLPKALPSRQQQQHPQQFNSNKPLNPQHPNVRPSHPNNPMPRPSHSQQSNPRPPYPHHLGSRPPHPQHSTSRPTNPQQARPEVSNSQQSSFNPPQPHQQTRPRHQPQQVTSSTAPRSQQAKNTSGIPNDPQRIKLLMTSSQHTVVSKPRPPQQGNSTVVKIKTHTTTQQPPQHTGPPPQQQHQHHQEPPLQSSTFKQHQTQQHQHQTQQQQLQTQKQQPQSQQHQHQTQQQQLRTQKQQPQSQQQQDQTQQQQHNNSKTQPKQHMSLRPMPHRLYPQHAQARFPPLRLTRAKKVPQQQMHHHHKPPSPPPPPTSHADSSTIQHSQNHHHSGTQPSTQQHHSNTRNTQTQHGIISKTAASSVSQHFAPPPPMPPPGQPQHTANTRRTKPPQTPQHQSNQTHTQYQNFLPQHQYHNYYSLPAPNNKVTMITSTPKTSSRPSSSSTAPQQQQQTPNAAGNDLNATLFPWLHSDSSLNLSYQGSAYNDLSGDGSIVDHEEVVTTSCDDEIKAEEKKMGAEGGAKRGFNMECNGYDATEYMQCAGNRGYGNCVDYGGGDSVNEGDGLGDSACNGGSEEVDLFSAISPTYDTNALDKTGTQHFTPQNTNSLGQVISSADEKDNHQLLNYDSSSSDDFPDPSTTSLGAAPLSSLPLAPPPPPAPAPSSAVSGSEWVMMNNEHRQGNTITRTLNKPPANTQLIQHHQNITQYAANTSTAAGRQQEVGPMKSRTVVVAAVAPSTLIPSYRPEAATPNVRITPWRSMMPPERRPVGKGKGKSKGATGVKDNKITMNPTHTLAEHQLAHFSTAFHSTTQDMRVPLDAPHNISTPQGNFSFQTPVGGSKRKLEDEEGRDGSVRVKRFLVPFPTPAPKLVLFNSSKGKLRANLSVTV